MVRRQLDYGCLFLPMLRLLFENFMSLKIRALSVITGAMVSSPINSLEVATGVSALFIRRSYLTNKFSFNFVSLIDAKGSFEDSSKTLYLVSTI